MFRPRLGQCRVATIAQTETGDYLHMTHSGRATTRVRRMGGHHASPLDAQTVQSRPMPALIFDPALRTLSGAGQVLQLAATESDLLGYLLRQEGRTANRRALAVYMLGCHINPFTDLMGGLVTHIQGRIAAMWPDCSDTIARSRDGQSYRVSPAIVMRSEFVRR